MNKKTKIVISCVSALALGIGIYCYRLKSPPPQVVMPPEEKLVVRQILDSEFDKISTRINMLEYQDDKLTKIPKLPFLDQGCEGEGCGSVKDLKLTRPVKLYSDANKKSKVLMKLDKGEELVKAKIFIKTLNVQKLPDKSIVLHYGSEGIYLVAKADLKIDDLVLEPDEVKNLKTESWVFVETKQGLRGWIPFYEKGEAGPISIFEIAN